MEKKEKDDSVNGPVQDAAMRLQESVSTDPRFQSTVVIYNLQNSGLAAGFFVSEKKIITNYHTVEGAKYLNIRLASGRSGTGRVEKTDPFRDLALLSCDIPAPAVKLLPRGSVLRAGTSVEAVGHPKGLEFSITKGVISAVRSFKGDEALAGTPVTVIQTDTPINPGNSGGPLFLGDSVVGINTMKLGGAGTEGIGFAVHVDEIYSFLDEN